MQLKPETLTALLSFLGVDPAAADLDTEVMAALDDTVGEKEVTEMQNRINTLEGEIVNRDLDTHGVTDAEDRKTWTKLLNADRESGLKALAQRKAAPTTRTAMTNRYPAQAPVASLTGDVRALRNRAIAELRANGLSFDNAYRRLKATKPELFQEEKINE